MVPNQVLNSHTNYPFVNMINESDDYQGIQVNFNPILFFKRQTP